VRGAGIGWASCRAERRLQHSMRCAKRDFRRPTAARFARPHIPAAIWARFRTWRRRHVAGRWRASRQAITEACENHQPRMAEMAAGSDVTRPRGTNTMALATLPALPSASAPVHQPLEALRRPHREIANASPFRQHGSTWKRVAGNTHSLRRMHGCGMDPTSHPTAV
jgi:hypothetical protein